MLRLLEQLNLLHLDLHFLSFNSVCPVDSRCHLGLLVHAHIFWVLDYPEANQALVKFIVCGGDFLWSWPLAEHAGD